MSAAFAPPVYADVNEVGVRGRTRPFLSRDPGLMLAFFFLNPVGRNVGMGIAASAPSYCVFTWSGLYIECHVSLSDARCCGRPCRLCGSLGDHQFRRLARGDAAASRRSPPIIFFISSSRICECVCAGSMHQRIRAMAFFRLINI